MIIKFVLCVIFVTPVNGGFKVGYKPVEVYETEALCKSKLIKAASILTEKAAGVACLPISVDGKSS